MKTNEYDLIIIGAGINGLALAAALSNSTLKILVVDKKTYLQDRVSGTTDSRVSAINLNSAKFLKSIKAFEHIRALRLGTFREILVWDANQSFSEIQFSAKSIYQAELGYIIEHQIMQQALLKILRQHSNIHLLESVELKDITEEPLSIILRTQAQTLRAKLIVAADGASSWLRHAASIPIEKKDYDHHALVATLHTEKPHQNTARQCFVDGTILALLPLDQLNLCSMVWSAPKEKIDALKLLPADAFAKTLTQTSENCLGFLKPINECQSFPLIKRHANHYVQPRIALIGDAAHTIHPLAGLGLNMGLADAKHLADLILRTHGRKRDIGLLQNLRPYERQRRPENQTLLCAIDVMKNVFTQESYFGTILRKITLVATNHFAPAKNFCISQAQMRK